MSNNSSSKYTFSSPQATYDNGNTSYSYTISTTYTPQFITFDQSKSSDKTNKNNNKPNASKPISIHSKSASGLLINKNNKLDSKPHQRSVSSNISMEYNYKPPSSNGTYGGTYGYTVTTYVGDSSNASTALGISQAPRTTFTFTAPQPMRHTPSVAYLNNNKNKPKIPTKNKHTNKKRYKPKSIISRSLPPTPTHPKKSRSFSHRNDIKPKQKQKQYTPTPSNTTENKATKLIIPQRINDIHNNDLSADDEPEFVAPIIRSRTLNDDTFNDSYETRPRNTFCASRAPIIKQSKSLNDNESVPQNKNNNEIEAKEVKEQPEKKEAQEQEQQQQQQQQENEDWQIMGDILFSLKHSLICRVMGINNNNKKTKNKNKNKPHLFVKRNEWQTFCFEEYAQELFTQLRAKWLDCNIQSDKYVKKLFGCTDKDLSVEELDINKSCRFYWRRLNTNSKSGQIFFQTINGEYIIKSMPKSEAEFFRKSFLDKYYEYMLSEPDSLLMHIMGCYNIQYKKQTAMKLASKNEYNSHRKQDVNKGVYVIVMKSILFCEMTPTVKMHKIYDLKGSKHNRTASRYKLELTKDTLDALSEIDDHAFEQDINTIENINDNIKLLSSSYSCGFYKPTEKDNINKFKNDKKNIKKGSINVYKRSKVLKDLDFMQDNEIINVGKKIKEKYTIQLRKDLDFLISMNVMDYSLLVGIHRLNINNKKKGHKRQHSHTKPKRIKQGNLFTFEFGGMCAEKIMFDTNKYKNGNKSNHKKAMKKNIYFTGIIDFLQKYNTKKKMESYYKRVKVSEGKDAISSVDSKTYANRLYDFIEKRII